jgi:SAM-dependent methyltransferase
MSDYGKKQPPGAGAGGVDREEFRYQVFRADRLLTVVSPQPGEKVLDACAGSGALSLAVAEAIAPSGRVTAIDASGDMLARLDAKIDKFGITNIDTHVQAEVPLPFRRDYFHSVVCAEADCSPATFGVVLREWWRVLRPGGSVLVASFAPQAFQPYARLLEARLAGRTDGGPSGASPVSVRSGEALRASLEAAGFEAVRVEQLAIGYHLRDAEAWWQVVWHGPLRARLVQLDEAAVDTLRKQHLDDVAQHLTGNGLWLDTTVIAACGRKPGNS